MGMKVKQESRVRTFFKNLFKISKKKNKDGTWKHTKLDKDLLYSLSRESGLNFTSSTSGSSDDLDLFSSNENNVIKTKVVEKIQEDETWRNNELIIKGSPPRSPSEKRTKDTKRVVKVNTKKAQNPSAVIEVQRYEKISDDESTTSSKDNVKNKTKKSKKAKKTNSKSAIKIKSEEDQLIPDQTQDQDLIDIDLDLVLSSFPSLRRQNYQPPWDQTHCVLAEKDNKHNEEISLQRASGVKDTRQVEALVESMDNNDAVDAGKSPSQVDVTCMNEHTSAGDNNNTQVEDVWERLVVNEENNTSKSKKSKKKNNKGAKAEEEFDFPRTNTGNSESEDKAFTKKAKRKRNRKSRKSASQQKHEDGFISEERLLTKEDTASVDELSACLASEEESYVIPEANMQQEKKKKNKRAKKRGNVRTTEDDLLMEMSEVPSRRSRHQVLYDEDLIIEQQPEPLEEEEEEQQTGSKKKTKKSKRRRLKIKFSKSKKGLKVKRYDELTGREDTDSNDKKVKSAREVGRRMWRACKTGWKYMKAGLVFYSKSPAGLSMNPVIKRYDSKDGNTSLFT